MNDFSVSSFGAGLLIGLFFAVIVSLATDNQKRTYHVTPVCAEAMKTASSSDTLKYIRLGCPLTPRLP
jgi:hypothetical protein